MVMTLEFYWSLIKPEYKKGEKMTIIAKTNVNFVIKISPNELKNIIGWNEVTRGLFDLSKLDVGEVINVEEIYTNIVNITNIKQKIKEAKTRLNTSLTELGNIILEH